MPRTSDRQKALRFVKEKLELSAMLESSSSDDDSEMSKSESNDDLKHTDSDSDLEWLLTSDSDVGGDPFELEANPDELSELYFVMDATRWPDRVERRRISEEFSKKGFPGCVGLIDGTLIPLTQRPKNSGECYYDRKCNYSMNAQVICDHQRKILFLYTGMPGSVSDLTDFKRTSLYADMNEGELFDRNQYLLGDSGYVPMSHLVSAYKRADLSEEREMFNMCVAKARVTNEHCIGVLKSRWHSLKQIRIQLNGPKHNLWMFRWIGICAKLHNFVMSQNDEWSVEDDLIVLEGCSDDEEELPDLPPIPIRARRGRTHGPATRPATLQERVLAYALAFHKQPGNLAKGLFRELPDSEVVDKSVFSSQPYVQGDEDLDDLQKQLEALNAP
ncbi:unnamed protein product [Calypogeia fissa]